MTYDSPQQSSKGAKASIRPVQRKGTEVSWEQDPAELIERQELLDIIRMLPDVIFRCEKRDDGKIYWTLNEGQLAAQFNLTTKEIEGKSLEELFPGGASDAIKEHFEAAFRGETEEFVNELGGRYFKHYPQPVYDEHGNVTAVVGFITDVTELTVAEREVRELSGQLANRVEELSQANRELEMYNHMLSHDLNNSISVIMMQCEIASRYSQAEHGARSLKPISQIKQAAHRMNGLLGDFLRLARASHGELQLEHIDLSEIAHEVAREFAQKDPSRQATINIQPGFITRADPALARVLLENLIGNAWKYASDRDEVRIEVTAEEKEGKQGLRIKDNGIGFASEDAARLFEPFHRDQRATRFPGTGIGLATVARIIERHGGQIEAEGRPDEGAAFWFSLPQA